MKYTADIVLNYLHHTFNKNVISNWFPARLECKQNWPTNSPDSNPCVYFLWVFLKAKIFPKRHQQLMELWDLIIDGCNTITKEMCDQHPEEVARRDLCLFTLIISLCYMFSFLEFCKFSFFVMGIMRTAKVNYNIVFFL